MDFLPEIFTGVAAALVTVWFAKSSDDKKNSLTYITDERRKWREEIRKETEKVVEIIGNIFQNSNKHEETLLNLQKSIAFFETRLNPFDEEDNTILEVLRSFLPSHTEQKDTSKNESEKEPDYLKKLEEFQTRIALLLKHDWERSKTEVNNKGKVTFILFTTLLCTFRNFLFGASNKIADIALNNGFSFCGGETCKICESVLKNQLATKSVNFIKQFLQFLQNICVLNTILWILTTIAAYYSINIVLSIFSSKILKDYSTNRCINIFFELFGATTRVSYEEKESVFKNKFCCIVLKTVILASIAGITSYFFFN